MSAQTVSITCMQAHDHVLAANCGFSSRIIAKVLESSLCSSNGSAMRSSFNHPPVHSVDKGAALIQHWLQQLSSPCHRTETKTVRSIYDKVAETSEQGQILPNVAAAGQGFNRSESVVTGESMAEASGATGRNRSLARINKKSSECVQ